MPSAYRKVFSASSWYLTLRGWSVFAHFYTFGPTTKQLSNIVILLSASLSCLLRLARNFCQNIRPRLCMHRTSLMRSNSRPALSFTTSPHTTKSRQLRLQLRNLYLRSFTSKVYIRSALASLESIAQSSKAFLFRASL